MKHTPKKASKGNSLAVFFNRFNYGGLALATVFFCLSCLPSLLPRPWVLQGVLSGLSIAVGYGVGTFLSHAIRWMSGYDVPRPAKRTAWRALMIIGPAMTLLFLFLGNIWQNQVHHLVGVQPLQAHIMIRTLLIALFVGCVGILAARGIRKLFRFLVARLDRILPRRVSVAAGAAILIVVFYWAITGLLTSFLVTQANNIYRARNNRTPTHAQQPVSPDRSGSAASRIAWDTLGYPGKAFVSEGPKPAELTAFSGQPAKEPIRIYAGLKSAPSVEGRAALAVAELQRTGAFQRKVLVLAAATGTGWLEPQSMEALEYMYGGDTAIVAQQYSYLPSWISFLVDKQNATDASQALYDAVYSVWSQLPKETRPKLYAYGLSLGSYGGQAPYSGVNDLRSSIDGALFMGTPNDTRLWASITRDRQPSSPEYLPVYKHDAAVRFAATNQQIAANQATWTYPRILYLQHASDPIVWVNFNVFWHKPDWLREARGPDVSGNVHWYPFVTGAQLAIDQFNSTSVPNGHGHNYPNTIASAWAAVTNPPNWTAQQTQKLQTIINNYKPNE